MVNNIAISNNQWPEFTIYFLYVHLQGHPAVRPELDLVEQEDQLTHEISLQEEINPEITLGMFSL